MELERDECKDHRIELRTRGGGEKLLSREDEDGELELLIDGELVHYNQLSDGLYFSYEYAYDWTENLMDLARKLLNYRDRIDEIQREAEVP